jgi:glucose-6-phosphate isomerase
MSTVTSSPAWRNLEAHARAMAPKHLRELFAADTARASRFSLEFDGIYLDYSKQRVTEETLALLLALARERDVAGWIQRMFAGERINTSENRAALHVALRGASHTRHGESDVNSAVHEARARCQAFVHALRSGTQRGATDTPIRDVVNLGIGGSDQGPRLVAEALAGCTAPGAVRVHFVANADPYCLDEVLEGLTPETTLFIVATKTFTTLETLHNAARARAWLGSLLPARHFAAVTMNREAARAFGVSDEMIFPVWDWLGGRFSLWSAMGLAAEIAIGSPSFDELLSGGRRMDELFLSAPLEHNPPVLLALLTLWNSNFLGARSLAVLPYDHRLRHFVPYLQQLSMESNGKRIDRDGQVLDYPTAPVVWGETGTPSQHSFHQLLHQSTENIPTEFIVPLQGGDSASRAIMVENAIAQSAALMRGTPEGTPAHAASPGNRPSSTLLLDDLSPARLGQLIALYEHKTMVEGMLWNINSFDQWGVETGKAIARALASQGSPGVLDASTERLLARSRRH